MPFGSSIEMRKLREIPIGTASGQMATLWRNISSPHQLREGNVRSPTWLVQWTRRKRPCFILCVFGGAPLTSVVGPPFALREYTSYYRIVAQATPRPSNAMAGLHTVALAGNGALA